MSEGLTGSARDEPTRLADCRRGPLTASERWRAARLGLVAFAATAVVATPLELAVGGGLLAVAFDTLVFGGLFAATAVAVSVEHARARQCPRCGQRHASATGGCERCGYDLATNPRYRCDERHATYLEAGICPCGRRLQPLPPDPLVHRSAKAVLRLGAWSLGLLVALALVLTWIVS